MDNMWILAQAQSSDTSSGISSAPVGSEGEATTATPSGTDTPPAQKPRPAFPPSQLIFLGLMFVLMYVILFRGPRKKQQQHKQMMQDLSKNDRVQTIGGIIGTVVDTRDDEITLKIDESNNTKIKIVRSAISRNMSKD
ncbi:MAG: preprotein translocase subunit YajC [Phycisphaerales bacterium]|nr:MAG: preprotein translocase subunit YajC [Phycisphaerales bacterium]